MPSLSSSPRIRSAPHRGFFVTDLARVYDVAVDFFDGPITARIRDGYSKKAAIAEAYDRYFAGPAAAGEVIWLVRHYWLELDALNRSVRADERVAPPFVLLGWLADAPPEYSRLITCMTYWPIGLDATGSWC